MSEKIVRKGLSGSKAGAFIAIPPSLSLLPAVFCFIFLNLYNFSCLFIFLSVFLFD